MLRTFETEWYLNQNNWGSLPYRDSGEEGGEVHLWTESYSKRILQVEGVADVTGWTSFINNQRVYEARMQIRDTAGARFSETFNTNFLRNTMAGVTLAGFETKRFNDIVAELREDARNIFQDLVQPGKKLMFPITQLLED